MESRVPIVSHRILKDKYIFQFLKLFLLGCKSYDVFYLSNITSKTSEILFEVWDSGTDTEGIDEQNNAFLGLGIVSIEELHIASVSRHVIPLQGRPYYGADNDDENNINGLLTVEFVLIDKNPSRSLKTHTGATEKQGYSCIKGKGR